MVFLRKGVLAGLLVCVLMVALSGCADSKPGSSVETPPGMVSPGPPGSDDLHPPSPPESPQTVPDIGSHGLPEKGLYTAAYLNEVITGLTFPGGENAGGDDAGGRAMITLYEGCPQLVVRLSDGRVLSKRFDGIDFIHTGIYMSAGDIDYDGYDELVVFLEASGSNNGCGFPIVFRVENTDLVELKSPLQCEIRGVFLPEFIPELCNGAVAFEKGNLRLTTEYPEYTGEAVFHRHYDLRHNTDTGDWYVFYSGLLAMNEAAEFNSYKDEIVVLHNNKARDNQWLEEIQKSDVVIHQVSKGQMADIGETTVILFQIMLFDAPWPHYPVLVVESNESTILWHWLDWNNDACAYVSFFYLHDVDGDGYDDIIAQYDLGGSGGYGAYMSAVYKVENNSLKQIFSSPSTGWVDFDTGFSLSFNDGFQVTIRNRKAQFETTFTRERYGTPYFDDDGKVMRGAAYDEMGVDSFYLFIPIDIDGDGVYEIMTAQYCSLWSRADGVGMAYTILKYDNQAGEMKVIKAGFWKFIDDGDEDYEAHNEQWALYEQNWYKG